MQAAPPSLPTPRLILTLLFLGLPPPPPLPPSPLYATAVNHRENRAGQKVAWRQALTPWTISSIGGVEAALRLQLSPLHFCWGRNLRSGLLVFPAPFPLSDVLSQGPPVSHDQSHHFHSDPCCCCSLIALLIAHSPRCLFFAPLLLPLWS